MPKAKYLNQNLISLDERLLKNFYLNKGFYNVKINSSFARLINDSEFELIYNIIPNKRYSFNQISLKLPLDFDQKNFDEQKFEKFLLELTKKSQDYMTKKNNLRKLNYQNTWNNVNQKILKIINEN